MFAEYLGNIWLGDVASSYRQFAMIAIRNIRD